MSKTKIKYQLKQFKNRLSKLFSQKLVPQVRQFSKKVADLLGELDITPLFIFLSTYFLDLPYLTTTDKLLGSVGLYYVSKYIFSELYRLRARK